MVVRLHHFCIFDVIYWDYFSPVTPTPFGSFSPPDPSVYFLHFFPTPVLSVDDESPGFVLGVGHKG